MKHFSTGDFLIHHAPIDEGLLLVSHGRMDHHDLVAPRHLEHADRFGHGRADTRGEERSAFEGVCLYKINDEYRGPSPKTDPVTPAAVRPRWRARRTSAPDERFELALRELSPQAAAQTRTYRARLEPVSARPLPLGATATLETDRVVSGVQVATIPATALTQANGDPAVWMVKHDGKEPVASVELMPVTVHGYRNDHALVSGVPAGGQVVTAGVQKMAPGLKPKAKAGVSVRCPRALNLPMSILPIADSPFASSHRPVNSRRDHHQRDRRCGACSDCLAAGNGHYWVPRAGNGVRNLAFRGKVDRVGRDVGSSLPVRGPYAVQHGT